MKKYVLSFVFAFLVGTSFHAFAECVGGTEFTSANNKTFCISTTKMNWWSAHAWCKANKMHLPTYAEACNRTFCTGLYCCSNLAYKWTASDDDAWINRVDGENNAISIECRDNGVVFSRKKTSAFKVLCISNN